MMMMMVMMMMMITMTIITDNNNSDDNNMSDLRGYGSHLFNPQHGRFIHVCKKKL
jgi:NADH:ubiquinone oxidoreductase subunit 6 (subunit J)